MTELLPRTRNHLKNSRIAIFSISSFTPFLSVREKLLRKYRKLLFIKSNFLFYLEGKKWLSIFSNFVWLLYFFRYFWKLALLRARLVISRRDLCWAQLLHKTTHNDVKLSLHRNLLSSIFNFFLVVVVLLTLGSGPNVTGPPLRK